MSVQRMGYEQMGTSTIPPSHRDDKLLEEIRALRLEQATTNRGLRTLYRLVDDFARTLLNSKFPFGKPVDRWRTR